MTNSRRRGWQWLRGGTGKAAAATIAVALIGLLGTSVAAVLQWRTALELERTRQDAELAMEEQRFRSELILRAMQPEDEQARREFLTFLIKAGLVEGLDQALDYFAEDSSRILPRSEPEPTTAYSPFRSFMAGAIASGGSREEAQILADKLRAVGIEVQMRG